MERKENGKNILITILVIIVILLVGLVAFNLGLSKANNEDNNTETNQDGTNNGVTETIDYSLYLKKETSLAQVDERKVTLNGEEHKLTLIYSYYKEKCGTDPLDQEQGIKPYDCYSYYLTILYDNKLTDIANIYLANYGGDLITHFEDKFVKTMVMNDTKTSEQYLSFVIVFPSNDGNASDEYYVAIYNKNDKIYEYESESCFVLLENSSNYKTVPYVQLSSNELKVIKIYTDYEELYCNYSKNTETVYEEIITIEDGVYNSEQIDITEKIQLSGGC